MSKIDILNLHEFQEEDELIDFYCQHFPKHLHIHNKAITVPHKHNFFMTVFFTNGTGIHEVDFEKHTVQSGSVFMINPGQTHYWELSPDIDGIIFFHSQSFYEIPFTNQSIFNFPFFYSVLNPSALLLEEKDQASIFQYFELLLKEYKQPQIFNKQKIIALIQSIYIDLSRIYLTTNGENLVKVNNQTNYIRKLEQLIEDNYTTEKSPAAYADMLNISIRHLNRLTQEYLGKSTTTLITERVILEAKRLIVYNNNSLAHIALELGYPDYTYFSRLFKKWVGIKPSDFGQNYHL